MHLLKPLAELTALGLFMAGFMASALILADRPNGDLRPSFTHIARSN